MIFIVTIIIIILSEFIVSLSYFRNFKGKKISLTT
jgi:hypothetical protein